MIFSDWVKGFLFFIFILLIFFGISILPAFYSNIVCIVFGVVVSIICIYFFAKIFSINREIK